MIQLCFLFFLETSTSIDKKNVSKTKKMAIDTFFACDDIPSNAPQTIKKSRFFTSQSDCAFPVQSMRKQCFKQKKCRKKIRWHTDCHIYEACGRNFSAAPEYLLLPLQHIEKNISSSKNSLTRKVLPTLRLPHTATNTERLDSYICERSSFSDSLPSIFSFMTYIYLSYLLS